jgi:class 3 adenylate cyclase
MFCDLVGSTAISAQLDAEEWRDLVSAYLDAASAAVGEMGGHVAKARRRVDVSFRLSAGA